MKISVTKTQIAQGKQLDFFACPLGLALSKAFPKEYVRVGQKTIQIGNYSYTHSPETKTFRHKFDTYGKASVKPFSFALTKLEKMKRMESVNMKKLASWTVLS